MPELPEVETIGRALREGGSNTPSLIEKRIGKATILWERSIATPSPEEFSHKISGQTIHEIGRRGKFLRFDLDQDTLLIHLRMSGDLWVEAQDSPPAPHHRLILNLEGGGLRLAFNDPRKFGRVWLTARPEEVLGKLGPEPLQDEFTAEKLFKMLARFKRQLKPLLMDQTFLAGMGNIYTDEALHLARLHPCSRSDGLNLVAAEALQKAIHSVLSEGILRNGASIDWVYRGGDYQRHFRVYQRAGQPCFNCSTPIERILVGQRSSYFCPNCQKL
jgi:formamidopyrimidine-DNA glycosylase